MNRIDRLTAILILLQTKKIIKADEIGRRFNISVRTVYRDIKALYEAGIPIGSEAGVGYFICDGYHLPPVMFTSKEANAMLLAEKLVEKFTDNSVNNSYKSALDKIKSVLPYDDKEFLEYQNSLIKVYPQYHSNGNPVSFLADIQKAIANRNTVRMDYFAIHSDSLTRNRIVEPLGLCFYASAWHLIGYCRLRNDYRDFRTDRIKSMVLLPDKFLPENRKTMQEYLADQAASLDLKPAVTLVDKDFASVLENSKYYFGFTGQIEKDDKIEMHFMVDDYSYLGNWLIAFGKKITVISPDELKTCITGLIKELQEHYRLK